MPPDQTLQWTGFVSSILVHELDYDQPREIGTVDCLTLCALPLAAQAIGFLAGGLGMAEPFPMLAARDAAVFFGAPVAIIALAIVWWRMALRRRLHRMLVYAVLAWFAFWLFGAIGELMRYLREPWNM